MSNPPLAETGTDSADTAAGETAESILRAYPYLEPGDIEEALYYAAFLADEQVIEFA